jgi:BirA family biotin operon repressor/biotin-[acetyl-CoA-carboxylase] ligase
MLQEAKEGLLSSQRLRNHILERLLDAGENFVSGAELSAATGISRTAVWKHVQALQDLGFGIEAVRHQGYRLVYVPDLVMEPLLRRHLASGMQLGRRVLYFPEIDSTNTLLSQLAADPAVPHGTVVAAGIQRGGRGRRGRVWFSPPEGLWFSVLLRSPVPLNRAAEITLVASVAVRRAILRQLDIPVLIKWPNDLLCNGRKVCGILAELRADGEQVQYIVLGIGINANIPPENFPKELQGVAGSLLGAAGRPVHRTRLAADILAELEALVDEVAADGPGFRGVADEWRSASHTLGRKVQIQTPAGTIEGFALDIDPGGSLIVRRSDGSVQHVHSGDVLF